MSIELYGKIIALLVENKGVAFKAASTSIRDDGTWALTIETKVPPPIALLGVTAEHIPMTDAEVIARNEEIAKRLRATESKPPLPAPETPPTPVQTVPAT